jgi:hypothetical protein
VAERLNHTIIEHAQAMLIAANLPGTLWGEAIMHTTWLKNHVSTRALPSKTPFEIATTGKKPNLVNIREFGCKVFVHTNTTSKLNPKSTECQWISFDSNSLSQ